MVSLCYILSSDSANLLQALCELQEVRASLAPGVPVADDFSSVLLFRDRKGVMREIAISD